MPMNVVYCFYIMRLYKREVVLGSLTDGKVWHTLKLTKENDGLVVNKDYYLLSSSTPDCAMLLIVEGLHVYMWNYHSLEMKILALLD